VLLNYFVEYPGVDCWARPSPSYVLPTEQWMCWEWVFDGEANQLEFYIDGQLERTVDQTGDGCLEGGNQVWDAPTFETLWLLPSRPDQIHGLSLREDQQSYHNMVV
jgi:hypothetical protein